MANDGWEELSAGTNADGWEDLSAPTKKSAGKTSLMEDVKMGLGGAAKSALSAALLPVGAITSKFNTDEADRLYDSINWAQKNIDEWSGADQGKKQGIGGAVVSGLAGLPGLPFGAAQTGKEFTDNGESMMKAQLATGIDTLGNVAGLAFPALGANPLSRAGLGAAANSAQDFATKAILSGMADQEQTKEQFAPTIESAVASGVTGGVMSALPTSRKKNTKAEPAAKIVEELNAKPEAWEQLDLPLETSAQSVAEMRARDQGQLDMFAPINEPLAKNIAQETPRATITDQLDLPLETGAQSIADMQNRGTGQVDAFSPVNDPVAKTIPDQLQPEPIKEQMDVPLDYGPESIALEQSRNKDQMDMFIPESQRGAVDIQAIGDELRAIVDGVTIGRLRPNITPEESKLLGEPASVDIVTVNPEHRGQGIGKELYAKFNDMYDGNIIPSGKTSVDAWKVWKRDFPDKVDTFVKQEASRIRTGSDPRLVLGNITDPSIAQRVLSEATQSATYVPDSQRGAVQISRATEPKEDNPILKLTLDSPEVVQAQKTLQTQRNSAAARALAGLAGYVPRNKTPAEVLASIKEGKTKDITNTQKNMARTVSPGMNSVVINTGNPLLDYMRSVDQGSKRYLEEASRQYMTGKDGLRPVLDKLNQKERNQVVGLLFEGDKAQRYVTRELMQKHGFNENQIQFVEKFYAANKYKLEEFNKTYEQLGLDHVSERDGYVPGVHSGDYKQIVYGKNKDGSPKVIGIIGENSVLAMNKARKMVKEQYPNATFSTVDRRGLSGNGQRADMFQGLGDVVAMLARHDPEFAKVQEMINTKVKNSASTIYAAHLHAMDKKGVFGSAGGRPWKDATENTNDFLKSYFRYWEEGITAHHLAAKESEFKALMQNPALDGMPNAKEYADLYWRNMTGRSLGTTGDTLNKLIDVVPRKIFGVGPSATREAVNQANKRAGQWTMGLGNIMFSAVQALQVPQMAWPEMINIAKRSGVGATELAAANLRATKNSLELVKASLGEKNNLDPLMKGAVDEASKRGLFHFSEFHDVNTMTQSKASKRFDRVADANRSIMEITTRPAVFYSFVEILRNSGLSKEQIYDTAYNATQRAMIDYSASERPLMYARLGVTGQMAGALSTFKHGQMSFLAKQVKDAASGNVLPLIGSVAMMAALAGAQGTPGYDDLDGIVKYLTGKFAKQQYTIKDLVMQDWDDWAKSGVLSAATDLNFQSRLSAANMLPDNPMEAVSPWANFYGKIGSSAMDAVKYNDPVAWSQLAQDASPSSMKGLTQLATGVTRDDVPVGKDAMKGNPVTEKDKLIKSITGSNSFTQTQLSKQQYEQTTRQKARQERLTSITDKVTRQAILSGLSDDEWADYTQQYIEQGGDPNTLYTATVEALKKAQMNKQQRLEGIPGNSITSIRRYQNFNE